MMQSLPLHNIAWKGEVHDNRMNLRKYCEHIQTGKIIAKRVTSIFKHAQECFQ